MLLDQQIAVTWLEYCRYGLNHKMIKFLQITFDLHWIMEQQPFEINMLIMKLGKLRMNVPAVLFLRWIFLDLSSYISLHLHLLDIFKSNNWFWVFVLFCFVLFFVLINNMTYNINNVKCIYCLFVCGFSSHSRMSHWYGDVTIAGEGLQILTYVRHSCPLSSGFFLASHIYCDTGHPFKMVISENPWQSHLVPSK